MATRARSRKCNFKRTLFFSAVLVLMFVVGTHILVSTITSAITRESLLPTNAQSQSNLSVAPIASERQTPSVVMTPTYLSNITNTEYLELVNRQHSITTEPDFSVLVPAWPTVAVRTVNGMYLHSSALRAVSEMFTSAADAGIEGLFVSSGFRGYDEQTLLYDGGANREFVLPPGHSEHHTGLGVDIMAVGVDQWELGNSRQGRWLAENSYRYGLVLRYPQGAEDITGIGFEPWHFRYVGKIHAYFMYHHNLVLEEYLQLIQDSGSITFEKGGINYLILFQAAQNGMIGLPHEMDFMVSSDNAGGYIVTAW